jgi:hypothetical protein
MTDHRDEAAAAMVLIDACQELERCDAQRLQRGPTTRAAMAAWCAVNAARADLLLVLAKRAVDEWEPDLAWRLLQAANQANGNVDDRLGLPENPFEAGPVERCLEARIVHVAQQALVCIRTKEEYPDSMTYSSPDAFREVIRQVEIRRTLETGGVPSE